jgi:4-phospho-D-threonate 3-dehydrogenase / 4-phospho-D-erythronate 3-dehydrogenase
MKPVLAITVGDCNGIGPEVALKAVASPRTQRICRPVLVGPLEVFEWYRKKLRLGMTFRRWLTDDTLASPAATGRTCNLLQTPPPRDIHPGHIAKDSGGAAGEAIATAARLALTRNVDGIVTSPVSKRALHLAGIEFPGHTEYLQHLSGADEVAMMLVAGEFRIGLVTIHIALSSVAASITMDGIVRKAALIHRALQTDWGIRKPRLAVLAINPHAGEDGDIGEEESSTIAPAIRALAHRGIRADGPFPADSFFARTRRGEYDAVLAMYHDQGLIPLKMAARGKAVNVTAGLPFVRTSPDHGTAFDIAGKGIADASSMIEAIRLAATTVRSRMKSAGKAKT